MYYIAVFKDNDNNIFKQRIKAICIELAQISANLIAYRKDVKVMKVSKADLADKIYSAVNTLNIDKIISSIKQCSENNETMLEELKFNIKKNGMRYDEIHPENCEHDCEQWIILTNHIISLYSKYNTCGIRELKKVIIFDETDSIVAEKTF